MSASTLWWIAAALAVAAELASGTFYLLMLALGLAAGAIAAHLGATLAPQLLSAALVGGGAVALWSLYRSRQPAALPAASNPDVNLDIGQQVHVSRWASDGSAHVHYRGADWTVRWHGGAEQPAPAPGTYVIRALQGNYLIVGP
jgi:membrane protein implicated in regulation of membrane protease activity